MTNNAQKRQAIIAEINRIAFEHGGWLTIATLCETNPEGMKLRFTKGTVKTAEGWLRIVKGKLGLPICRH